MSLTSNLSQKDSFLTQFFAEHLPGSLTACDDLNRRLARYELKVDGSLLTLDERAIAGTAIDYRVRTLFDHKYRSDVLHDGALNMGPELSLNQEIWENLLEYRSRTIDETRLSQISIVFAYLDHCYRNGRPSQKLKNISSTNIDSMLNSIDTKLVDDVMEQTKVARRQDTKNFFLGPTFDGSHDVGGADADLIADSVLIDFKSTSKCKLTGTILRQLIGYWLLDYSDRYALEKVGVYFTRYEAFFTVDIPELLHRCGFESKLELREQWREACRLRFEEAEKASRQRTEARKRAEEEAARAKRKLSLARRKWRLAGASAMLANPRGLKKSKLKIIAEIGSGKTNYAHMSPHERAWLDEDFARAFMTFENWQNLVKTG
jgi:hypothetical protein